MGRPHEGCVQGAILGLLKEMRITGSDEKLMTSGKNWIAKEKRPRWVLFLREDYQHVNTNNLLESWFNALETHALEGKRGLRIDLLIYKLQGPIDQDFRTQYFKVKNGIQLATLSQYDQERLARAMAVSPVEARAMVCEKLVEKEFAVKSSEESGVEYSVAADVERGLLQSCSSPDYVRQKIPCKHMCLVSRIYDGFDVQYAAAPSHFEHQNRHLEFDLGPPLESFISPVLLREEKKRKREEVTTQAFEECEEELMVLWKELGRIVYNRQKRKCTLKDMQDSIAELRNVIRTMTAGVQAPEQIDDPFVLGQDCATPVLKSDVT
ncbi:hypothetical protein BX616_000247 [Lobosporangium transversale]|nr:hypothetical protein BX616_000247 [Lobosporangium transversale]